MSGHDEFYDPLFARMVAAFEGPSDVWRRANEALRDAIVAHAVRRSPYYRDRVPPDAPFEELPILTKAVARRHADELLAEGVPEGRRVELLTSGSTGEPLRFYRDTAQGPAEHTSGQRFLRHLQGIPQGATMVWVGTAPRPVAGRRDRRLGSPFARRPDPAVHAVPVRELTPERVVREVERWSRFREYFVYGHASALEMIVGVVEARRLSPSRPPVAVVTTADLLTEDASARIERAFGCPVHSWYGSNEFNGFVAGTLPGSRRYAFNPLLVHAELLDERGAPAPPGAPGRLILTDLNNHVMPFIRYDTDDLAVPDAEGFVGGFRLADDILGRTSEVIRFPSGRFLSGTLLGWALFRRPEFSFYDVVRRYQCAQTGPNEVELRVVWEDGRERPTERLREALRSVVDEDTTIHVRAVDELERLPSGKAWLVRRF